VTFNWARLKKSTLYLIGLIAAGTLSVQEEWVKDHVIPLLANHPHLSTLGAGMLYALTLLHNPAAMQVINKLTAEQKTEQLGGGIQTTTVVAETTKQP
jgi:hypothetical protein